MSERPYPGMWWCKQSRGWYSPTGVYRRIWSFQDRDGTTTDNYGTATIIPDDECPFCGQPKHDDWEDDR